MRDTNLIAQLNQMMVQEVEKVLSNTQIITNNDMEKLNLFLFSSLSRGVSRRDKKYVIKSRDGRFALRLAITVDDIAKSRRTRVDRAGVHEQASQGIEEALRSVSSGTSSIDGTRDIYPVYVQTYAALEDGIGNWITILDMGGDLQNQEVIMAINSGDVYYEFGGFRITPTTDGREWGMIYETSPLIKMSIKDDFSWGN